MTRRRNLYYKGEPSPLRREAVKKCPGVVGVTLVTPSYRLLAHEAISRAREFAGLDTVAIYTEDEPSFLRKLDICSLVGRRKIVFYDADLWFVAPVDFNKVKGFAGVWDFGAVAEDCFPYKDCLVHNIPSSNYCNTGLLVCDFTKPLHRKVFQDAKELAMRSEKGEIPGVSDHGEQSWLNIALFRLGMKWDFMPFSYNYFDFAVEHLKAPKPEKIYGYHAAGIHLPHKLAHLKAAVSRLP